MEMNRVKHKIIPPSAIFMTFPSILCKIQYINLTQNIGTLYNTYSVHVQ